MKVLFCTSKFLFILTPLLLFTATGCTTAKIIPTHNIKAENSHSENLKILKEKYGHEWKYNKTNSNEPPKLGLTLSGGGTRSASFNIGVLKALHEQGILDEVDIISGVSGGTYVIYWYYSQHYYMDVECKTPTIACYTTDDIFKAKEDFNYLGDKDSQDPLTEVTKYRFQHHLENSSEIVNNFRGGTIGAKAGNVLASGAKGFTWTLMLPFHWTFNGIFDMDLALNPFVGYYRNGIERTYGFNPTKSTVEKGIVTYKYSNDKSKLGIKKVAAKKLYFSKLRTKMLNMKKQGKHLPYFIINTTARYGRAFNKYDYKGDNGEADKNNDAYRLRSIYEFTPEHQGTDMQYVGYKFVTDYKEDSNFFYKFTEFFDIFDIYGEVDDVSHAVAISGAAVDAQAEQMGGVESVFLRSMNLNQGIYLPNHSKNSFAAGLYKLLPYPLYTFTENVLMKKPASIYLSDGGHSENLGIYSLIKRGVKNIIVSDAESDNDSIMESAKKLKRRLKNELGLEFVILDNPGPINVYNAKPYQSVMRAEVNGLKDENDKPYTIKITYIKLSMDKSKLDYGAKDKYPDTVIRYAENDKEFPHNATFDVFYDKHQFRAYRDLGYSIAREINMERSGDDIILTGPSKE